MAAAHELRLPEVLELKRIGVDQLAPLLEREIGDWRRQLDWDFRPSANLVRRFVSVQALNGYALVESGAILGYSYFVSEEHKGMIGDLYLLPEHHTVANENRLLGAVVQNLMHTPHVGRIESQLMMLKPVRRRHVTGSEFLRMHWRQFMAIDSGPASALGPSPARDRFVFEHWRDAWQDAAAQLIAEAYESHIDGSINDQYRSAAGARRFLANIIQYPGCGEFFQPSSYLAFEKESGRLCGMSLASLLARDVGHITQLCVTPSSTRTGLGYELLRRSLYSLASAGCRKTSLTVTSANVEAVRLYERVGFDTVRTFTAMVWDGF